MKVQLPGSGIAAVAVAVAVLMLTQLAGLEAQLVLPGTELAGLPRKPRFSIQQQGGAAWLVRPNGQRFFSLGVCCVDQGVARADFDPANPGYAAWQHYADSNRWATGTSERLKSWGFTTIGG